MIETNILLWENYEKIVDWQNVSLFDNIYVKYNRILVKNNIIVL